MATAVRRRPSGGGGSSKKDRDYSDDGPQPFDQRVRGRSVEEKLEAMRIAQKKYEEALEDGELPSLQQSHSKKYNKFGGMMTMGGRLVNGKRTTTRPLSPPSQAGLVDIGAVRLSPVEIHKQRQFWSQFEKEAGDDDDDDKEDADEASERRMPPPEVDEDDYDDDVPDDERLDRKISNIQRKKAPAKRARRDEASDYSSGADPPSTVESSVDYGPYADGADADLCSQTLTVLGDMCGISPGGGGLENSSKTRSMAPKRRQIKSELGEVEEEHTAIEVEFVEPEPVELDVEDDEPPPLDKRKSAYLSAMARRAKEDFQNRRDEAPGASSSADDRTSGSAAVYNNKGGSASVVGGGSVASNASSRGIVPRLSSSAMSSTSNSSAAAGGGGGGSVSSDVYNRFTASDKRKFLKLINNGLSPAEASEQVLQERKAAKDPGSLTKSPSRGLGFGFWKKSPNKYVDDEAPEGNGDPVLATRSYGSQDPTSPAPDKAAVAIVPVPDLNELRVIDETAPESESETEGPFAKSGINYYDAIRRREQEDSDGDTEEFPATSANAGGNSNKSKSRGLFAPKLMPRFTPLDDKREKTPAVRSRSAPREGGRRGGAEEASAVAPEAPAPRGEPAAAPAAANRRAASDNARDALSDPELAAGLLAIAEIKQAIRAEAKPEEAPLKPVPTVAATGSAARSVPGTTSSGGDGKWANKAAGDRPVVQQEAPMQSKPPPKPRATVQTLSPQEPKGMARKDLGDSVSNIEQNLLRPAPREESTSGGADKPGFAARAAAVPSGSSTKPAINGFNRQDDQQASLVPKPPLPPMVSGDADRRDSLDVSMHTYMSSTEMYAPSNASVVSAGHDNMSVYTVGTGVSAMSQSSRVRRPGAAKERIAKAKQTDGTPSRRGWHESMKAAAESQNRVWDPRFGWVDYTIPEDHAGDMLAAPHPDKIRVDLQKAVKPKRSDAVQADNGGEFESASVPFPSQWEAERQQMLREVPSSEPRTQAGSTLRQTEGRVIIPDADSLMKSDGFAESIPSTTSNRSASRSTSVHVESPPEQSPEVAEAEVIDLVPTGGTSTDRPQSQVIPQPTAIAQDADASEKLETVGSTNRALDEKYMQIGDNGSVRSIAKQRTRPPVAKPRPTVPAAPLVAPSSAENYISDDDDDDQVPLLNETGSFASIGMIENLVSPTVTVVKQKVDAEDLDFFEHNDTKSPSREINVKTRTITPSDPRAPVPSIQSSASGSSTRRSGPVDLDEEVEASDRETDDDNAWGPVEGDDARNVELSTSSSGLSKPVPRIRGSKRDTSPVKVRKSADDVFAVYDSPTASPVANTASVTPESHSSDAMEPSQGQQRGPRIMRQDDAVGRPVTRSPSGSQPLPSVRARLQQWEVRTGKSDDGLSEAASDVAPEWKTLLDKKVSAELAAAKQRQVIRQKDSAMQREQVRGEVADEPVPVGGNRTSDRRGSPDDDSLFHFRDQTESRNGPSKLSVTSLTEASQESPIENIEEDSDKDVSEAYGPSPGERNSFFKRFIECTAPVMPLKHACGRASDSAPSAVFEAYPMPVNSRSASLGKVQRDSARVDSQSGSDAEVVPEHEIKRSQLDDDKVQESDVQKDRDTAQKYVLNQAPRRPDPNRPRSAPRPQSQGRGESRRGPSSVVSEDFGAKTAYLEAIAARTAVSKPRRSSSRHRSRSISGSSVTSTASSQHSEKWKAFLERKRSGMTTPPKSRAATDVSQAAEKYASVKVEEMMLMMSTKHKAADYKYARDPTRSRTMQTPASIASEDSSEDWRLKRSDSVRAAEDLAAARVEAMMAALSGNHLDEAEI